MEKVKQFFKNHYKKLIAVGVLAVAGTFIGTQLLGQSSNYTEISQMEVTSLNKKEFVNSINENGKASSETSRNVYAELALPIKDIEVEVGDKVKKGDVIATLDDSSIKQQIDQKEAMISSTNRSTGSQIKNARDKLNEAIKNRNNGTNSQIVAAENALTSAYDAWQTAEKTYENYANSLTVGYNEAIAAQKSNDNSLEIAKDTANMNLAQSQDKLNELGDDIIRNRELASNAHNALIDLESRDKFLTERINKLTLDIEAASSYTPESNIDPSVLQELQVAESDLQQVNLEISILTEEEAANAVELMERRATLVKTIGFLQDHINNIKLHTAHNPYGDVDVMKEELQVLQADSQKLKEKIAEIKADKQNYDMEVESAEKAIQTNIDQIEQNKQQIDFSYRNEQAADLQKDLTAKNLEDNLRAHRKNADDLKNQYEASKRNLEVAKVMANDEINSLKNSIDLAAASGDNSLNYVDIKYLNEDLDQTIIKAPIDGTITEINMVKGQNPQDFLAKVETVETLIIESQVKEFDVNFVNAGMDVEITSDASGSKEVSTGKVISVSPTPTAKSPEQAAGNEVSYKVKIELDDNQDEIKPGMNVRVKYILDKKKDVFVVPSNSVYEKNDKFFVLALPKGDVSTVKEVEVTVTGESDFESVIEGDNLKEDMIILNSPDLHSPGDELKVVNDLESEKQE